MEDMIKELFGIKKPNVSIVKESEETLNSAEFSIPLKDLLEFEPSDSVMGRIMSVAKKGVMQEEEETLLR